MSIQIITTKTSHFAHEWYSTAINTPEVARFLNMCSNVATPDDFVDDWMCLTLMDEHHHGLIRLRPARSYSNLYCDMSCWVLPSAGKAKSFIAGKLIRAGFAHAANRFGSKYVDWCVHGTNEESMRFSRRHSEQVGHVEEGGWDIALGRWVSSTDFRKNVESFRHENQLKMKRSE